MADKNYHTIRTSELKVLDNAIKEGLSTQNPVLYAAAINRAGRSPEDTELYAQGQHMIEKDERRIKGIRSNYTPHTIGEKELKNYLKGIRTPGEVSAKNTRDFSKQLVEGIKDSLKYQNFQGVQVTSKVSQVSSGSARATYRLTASFSESVGGSIFPVTCSYTYEQDHDDHEDTPQSVSTDFLKAREKTIRKTFPGGLETSISGNTLTITPEDQ